MDMHAFASLANISLPFPSTLLASACCPDKDLVAVVTRLGSQDRLGLWKIQGTRVWEVDILSSDGVGHDTIKDIFWSPDGQTLALAHDPPLITLHSVQTGKEERVLPMVMAKEMDCQLTTIWWFPHEPSTNESSIPDIFRRQGIITGSSHSILKMLPLLDGLPEDSQRISATELFAFQGSQMRTTRKSSLPPVIRLWPTLQTDVVAASISVSSYGQAADADDTIPEDRGDETPSTILVAADNLGRLHFFLDGSYPMGSVPLQGYNSVTILAKHKAKPSFFAYGVTAENRKPSASASPTRIHLPQLERREVRDMARLSSTARELSWCIIRVVHDMKAQWCGSDSVTGAREMGPKWMEALAAKQRDQFGQEAHTILELTSLLLTGRASEAVTDFFGSAEQMSERGIRKWESTVSDTLLTLREYSEKRLSPALQRLHLVLEEVYGWSQLPRYSLFDLNRDRLKYCLDLAKRGIFLSSWLGAAARKELGRFKEFIAWLRFETASANPSNDTPQVLQHDILEVNNYFISGLAESVLDGWFVGPVPTFSLEELADLHPLRTLEGAVEEALKALETPGFVEWQNPVNRLDLTDLDRNIDALVEDLTTQAQAVFFAATQAAARSAVVSEHQPISQGAPDAFPEDRSFIRSRVVTVCHPNEPDCRMHYLAMHIPPASEREGLLCITLQEFDDDSDTSRKTGVAVLQCGLVVEDKAAGTDSKFDLLDADFFDDELLVVVYRLREDGRAYIGTAQYHDLGYQEDGHADRSSAATVEDLMGSVIERWRAGELVPVPMPIRQRRALSGCDEGGATLAVNGRKGRRVACVLDGAGTGLETLDMEGYGDEMDVETGDGE